MSTFFSPDNDQLRRCADRVLNDAKRQGADNAVVSVARGQRRTLRTRHGEIDTLIQNQHQGLSLTLFYGQRTGSVSVTQLTDDALDNAVTAAGTLARYGDADPWSGLPDPQQQATDIVDLKLFHPQTLTVEEALRLARETEEAMNSAHRGRCLSEGAEITSYQGEFILANSQGFCAGYPSSSHTLMGHALAQNASGRQQGFWHDVQRSPLRLAAPQTIGHIAADRAVAQLGAAPLATRRCPVIFEAPVAHSLVHHLVAALSGGALYRSASFLGLCEGETITASHLSLREDPFLEGGWASGCFDGEGVAGNVREVITHGVACGYFLGSYSARRLGRRSTGNASGAWNLTLSSTCHHPQNDLSALLRQMHRGLLVTALLGNGVNPVTGDYSQGVAGLWIENGEIQAPVTGITIAGNLKTLWQRCIALGSDAYTRGALTCGSLLIDDMQIAGQ
ncbi:TPA: TldD/PmbA family protein [Klebsiella variicola subsp. variicola]|uniref:TldD/PmbA family protein n=1 Tax=Klebsiella variicola TaxID=244366 RepID=UPI00125ABF06|nr:metallopeptidase TldD-related protein [Klebsiella variicola]VAT76799.1 peptidase PmbA [Klebsiella variicola]HDK6468931.1 peptidase U62 [Klebsiella variicola]HDZ0569289.1 peptidase U62 [Klebsiella quasipneumoniae]